MIAISFALPEESKDLVKRLTRAKAGGPRALPVIEGLLEGRETTIVHSGMGMASASARLSDFLKDRDPGIWIAAGLGGGLIPELKLGDIVMARNFSDARLFAAIAGVPARAGSLITAKDVVETAEAKRDLARHTGADVVDMETAAIQRLCAARAIPMLAVRAISDTAAQDLPVPAGVWFDMARQCPRPLPLVLYLAARPGRIAPFARFVRGVHQARAQLADFLVEAIRLLPEK